MPGFRLYGDSRSGNCYKAALILRLTGRAFEWEPVDVMSGATRTAAFLAMNPNGKVPLLRWPDGRFLAESNAMLLALGEGSPYLPEDRWARSLAYQWLFFEQYSHEPSIAVVRFLVCFAGREREEGERIEVLRRSGNHALAVMEQTLRSSEWLAGPRFSVADIALYAYTHVAHEGGFDLAPFPAIRTWLGRVEAQPGYLPMNQACR